MPLDRGLTLVGAGPKTLAVLAKAKVLKSLGCEVPEIHVIERNTVGAHWNGKYGYTDGRQSLGTSAEKDLGFPYETRLWGTELGRLINGEMLEFSWLRFLLSEQKYGDWVDRGKPAPSHSQWAKYLVWARERCDSVFTWHQGNVVGLERQSDRWNLQVKSDSQTFQHETQGLVLTGPGNTSLPDEFTEDESVVTTETFWARAEEFLREDNPRHIAIVGSGETAAAVALALAQRAVAQHELTIISPTGVTYSRGESYRENKLYTDPDGSNWTMLTPKHRQEFIRRTDRGVFSQHAIRYLDQAQNLEIVAGRVQSVETQGGRPILGLQYGEQSWNIACDVAVLALGTDPVGPLRDWLGAQQCQTLCQELELESLTGEVLEKQIQYDLSVRNLEPRIHIPMIAGLSQGPGFPNLSCLGRVSDRILSTYVPLPKELQS